MSRQFRAIAAALLFAAAASGADDLVYAAGSRGIQGYRLNLHTARWKSLGLEASLPNGTFLAAHPDHRYLYAAGGDASGSVSAFLIDPKSGKLSPVNQASTGGDGPCRLALDREGRYLAVSNCAGGSVAILPLRKDGGVGQATAVLPHGAGAHPQGLQFSADNRFLLAADAGLNRIYVYRFDVAKGTLAPAAIPYIDAPSGAGVAELAFHPDGRVLFALNQDHPGVTIYRFNPEDGGLSTIQTIGAAPTEDARAGAAAGIALNASGTVVYAGDRGFDSMALLAVDPVRFTLSMMEFTPLVGGSPSSLTLDPSGAYLLVSSRDSGNLDLYSVHPHTGQLRPASGTVHVDGVTGAAIVPAGQ